MWYLQGQSEWLNLKKRNFHQEPKLVSPQFEWKKVAPRHPTSKSQKKFNTSDRFQEKNFKIKIGIFVFTKDFKWGRPKYSSF